MTVCLNTLMLALKQDPRLHVYEELSEIVIEGKCNATDYLCVHEGRSVIWMTRLREADPSECLKTEYSIGDPELVEKIKRDIEPLFGDP